MGSIQTKNITRSTRAEIAHSDIGWLAIWLMQTVMETPATDAGVRQLLDELHGTVKDITQTYKRTPRRVKRGA